MEIHWSDRQLRLEQADNFRAFKVVVVQGAHPWSTVVADFQGTGRFDGDQACWVSQHGLQVLAGTQATDEWLQSMRAMVAKARPHGWVDEATGDIRAHVEKG